MKIEFVEYYPKTRTHENKKSPVIGTVHVYICDLEMDIRGIMVVKKGAKLFYRMPQAWGIDPETKQKVQYPVVSFTDLSKNREIFDWLKKHVEEDILARIAKDRESFQKKKADFSRIGKFMNLK